MNFRERMARFMSGRNGTDRFCRILSVASMVLMVISIILQYTTAKIAGWIIFGLAVLVLGYSYFRMFSRNLPARDRENRWFCNLFHLDPGGYSSYGGNYGNYGGYTTSYSNEQKKFMDRKTHKIFKCPNCSQKIRVPRHKGKISIKCPTCRIEFVKKT